MLRPYVWEVIRLIELLDRVQGLFKDHKDPVVPAPFGLGGPIGSQNMLSGLMAPVPFPEEKIAELYKILNDFLEYIPLTTNRLPMPLVEDQILRIKGSLERKAGAEELARLLQDLALRITDELKRKLFFYVRPEFAQYYGQKAAFGEIVNERFPAAIDDIEASGNCLALSQGTATVLHLMRVMEVGLKMLAKALKIPYAPSWESYLKQISTRIDAKHKTKGIRWRRDEHFFRDVSGDLISVKQAWRNPTMHVVRKYSPEDAEEIYKAVRTFMNRMATELPVYKRSRRLSKSKFPKLLAALSAPSNQGQVT
jgi:hypothetical protein